MSLHPADLTETITNQETIEFVDEELSINLLENEINLENSNNGIFVQKYEIDSKLNQSKTLISCAFASKFNYLIQVWSPRQHILIDSINFNVILIN